MASFYMDTNRKYFTPFIMQKIHCVEKAETLYLQIVRRVKSQFVSGGVGDGDVKGRTVSSGVYSIITFVP